MSNDPFTSHWGPTPPVERDGLVTHEFFVPTTARKQHHCGFAPNPEVRSVDCAGWIEPGQVYVAMQLTARDRWRSARPARWRTSPGSCVEAEQRRGPMRSQP